ncbi:MAG: glycoside hydrolase family 3 C-terminal domain-containing protein [Paludibacter sp.]
MKAISRLILLSLFSYATAYSQQKLILKTNNIPEIIKAMTLEEKAHMVLGMGDEYLWNTKSFKGKPGKILLRGQAANTYNIERLGIPSTILNDGPAGLRIDTIQEGVNHRTYCTAFPTATALASTWNKDLVRQVGVSMGNEVLEFGSDMLLAPGLNLQRNPLCGRNFEYYSEDPLISGEMAAAMVNGIQSNNVGACLKHFAANNIETNRRTINELISQRALREIYLRGFEIAVKKSNPWMLMTSYNKINGYYTAEDKALLQDILRKEWNYNGVVVTDWGSGQDVVAQMRAGNELIMPGGFQSDIIIDAVKRGLLDEAVLDRNIEKILQYVVKTPTFRNYTKTNNPDLIANSTITRTAAGEAMVLLQNRDNTLPLSKTKVFSLFGKTSYNYITGGTGSGRVNNKHTVSLLEGLENSKFKIDKKLQLFYKAFTDSVLKVTKPSAKVRAKNIIDFAAEPKIETVLIEQAVKNSDVAVITLGRNAGETWDRDENDYFKLSYTELSLIKSVSEVFHAAKKKVIVILNIGGPIEIESWKQYTDAILLSWQTGQEGGNALVDILKGQVNPSGKLAVTFPVKYADVPSSKSFPGVPSDNPVNAFYEEGIYVGYRYYQTFNVKPAYEFGFGMSYTNFTYSPVTLSSNQFNGNITATVTVKNTGKVAGKEVAQLYVTAPVTSVEKPMQELKGFAKTRLLKPGESETLTFTLDTSGLASFWTGKNQWVAEKGIYEVRIGASSSDIRSKTSFNLEKDIIVEQVHDVMYPNVMFKEFNQKDRHIQSLNPSSKVIDHDN